MIIKNGTRLNGIPVDSTSILPRGRVNPNITIKPNSMTIHNTSNPNATADGHRRFLLNHNKANATGAETSWHFTVDDVEIVQHMDTSKKAYHAGKANNSSIGIEICEFENVAKQAKATANAQVLIRYLMNELKLVNIYTHKYWTGKNCPRKLVATFDTFKRGIPTTITVNGSTKTSAPLVKAPASNVSTVVQNGYTFKATDKHYGIVVIKAEQVNIRKEANLNSSIVQVTKKGDAWKSYGKVNGLHKLSEGKYITSNSKYVDFIDNPFLDDYGKVIKAPTATNGATTNKTVTTNKATTKLIKVTVGSLYTYNSANWNDKGSTVKAGEVFTVVKELTVSGSKMYQLKSGVYISANPKYVKVI